MTLKYNLTVSPETPVKIEYGDSSNLKLFALSINSSDHDLSEALSIK